MKGMEGRKETGTRDEGGRARENYSRSLNARKKKKLCESLWCEVSAAFV